MKRGLGNHWGIRAGLCLALAGLTGCGILTYRRTDFEDELVGADGQEILLDDINAIRTDPDLDATEKRQALIELGIEDEDLLDAILAGA